MDPLPIIQGLETVICCIDKLEMQEAKRRIRAVLADLESQASNEWRRSVLAMTLANGFLASGRDYEQADVIARTDTLIAALDAGKEA